MSHSRLITFLFFVTTFCHTSTAVFGVGETLYDGVIIDRPSVYDAYPSHLFIDGIHHIWYCGASDVTNTDAIFYTTKSTPLSQVGGWSSPLEVVNNTNVAWATQHICDPNVIRGAFTYNSQPYEYAMYFTGDDGSAPQGIRAAVGVAFSNDRVSWVTHPARIITATDPLAAEYGAGQSTVAWAPDNSDTLYQLYRDSTAVFGVDSEILLAATTDGLTYSPIPGTETLIPETGVNGINATSPDLAYNPLDRHWYAITHTFGFGGPTIPDFRVRLLRSKAPDALLAEWDQLAEWDVGDSGEETNIEPSLARNENGSLYIDENGWLYVFFTVGEWIPNFNTWGIAQARYRVVDPKGKTVADNFTNMGPRRRAGQTLTGHRSEAGGRVWAADARLVFDADATITTDSAGGGQVSTVPFVLPTGARTATVEASVDLTGSNWIAIGFSANPSNGIFTGQLWILLHNITGNVDVRADGLANTLVSVPAPGLNPDWNHLALSYDSVDNSVSAWCNGKRVLDDFSLDTLNGGAGFTPNILFAGFHLNEPVPSASKIDRFAVSQARYIFLGSFETGDTSTWDDVCNAC